MSDIARRSILATEALAPVTDFYFTSRYGERRGQDGIADFTFGNPHEMPLDGLVQAIRHHAVPHDQNWFAYKTSETDPQAFLAASLSRELGLDVAPPDIALTAGAFAAISVAFRALLDAGDEVVFSQPAWFCYEPMLLLADLVPRIVDLKRPDFDLDLAAIEAAIGPRTRLVIVNTPHNPTGRIVAETTLKELADLLERASRRIGHRIYLLADEPYRRLRFDGRDFVTPAAVYPWTLVSYSYGKVLLAPGQRLGYLMISPLMPDADRKALADCMFPIQLGLGWCFPNAVMQYALPDIDGLSIDIAALARRRDRLTSVLSAAGCRVLAPEGTFYLWAKWPEGTDPDVLLNRLADRDVFVIPGSTMNAPNHFRISLTASDEMVDQALPAFAEMGSGKEKEPNRQRTAT